MIEKDQYEEWRPSVVAKADRMLADELGRRAAREGWISHLWDHYRRGGARPTAHEISRMVKWAHEFNERYAQSEGALRALGNSMLARRDRLAKLTGDDE